MTRKELHDELCALPAGQLDGIISSLGVPVEYLPGTSSALATRIAELIRYLEGHDQIPALEKLLHPASISTRVPALEISIEQLPRTSVELFGRDDNFASLKRYWDDGANVVSILAWGGVGKSSLVNAWLQTIPPGAERVYGWSFYNQGTTDRTASSEGLVETALRWFGDKDPTMGSSREKGARLASLVRHRRTLLILDGLEPLQGGPGPEEGMITDHAIAALVRELGANNPGMCLITSRLQVTDLENYGAACPTIRLEALSPATGAQLLRARGVKGAEDELQQASKDHGGHGLALTLLGSYLQEAHHGDIRRSHEIGPPAEDDRHGAHARRIMRLYERWFPAGPETAILRILGLFDRPARAEEIASLRALPVIQGLNDGLQGIPASRWNKALSKLRRVGLLASPPDGADAETLDAHPLVREHFGEALRREHPEAWRAGHGRLHDHLKRAKKRRLPETLEEMLPLYRAVRHGCLAERWSESFALLKDWIRQGDEHLSLKKLGAVTADLGAFASFFTEDWNNRSTDLSPAELHWLENSGGVLLRAEGRLNEAAKLLRAAIETARAQRWDGRAAESYRNLASTETSMGNLADASKTTDLAIEFADKSSDVLPRVKYRDYRAHLLTRLGRLRESREAFEEVERMSRACEPEDQRSFPGGNLAALLMELGEPEAALAHAEAAFALTNSGGSDRRSLLNVALSERSLGRALAALGRTEEADAHFNASIEHIIASGRRDHLAPGFLDRASANLVRDPERARRDVEEAMSLAVHARFRTIECDAHLIKARLDIDAGKLKDAKASLTKARSLVEDTGYLLREPSLLLVEARYRLATGARAAAVAALAQARTRIEAMGLKGLLDDLAEVERACAETPESS